MSPPLKSLGWLPMSMNEKFQPILLVAGSTVSGTVSQIPLHASWVSSPKTALDTNSVAYCCPCVVYGTVRSTFTGKPDDCVQDGAIFCVSSFCCLAPALGAINRYEMREKYNIIGLHQSETAGVKKHFEGKPSNELLGKKDGHGFLTVSVPLLMESWWLQDLVTWYCCGVCALCQEKREIDDLVNSGKV